MADKVGPRKRTPRDPSGTQLIIDQKDYQISFDPQAFDLFVKSQGIWVTHYRAVADARGMATRGDNRDVLAIRPIDSDGFIYRKSKDLQVLFTNNSLHVSQEALGELSLSTAYMTMPRFYPGTTEAVLIHPWDKFFLKDIEVRVLNLQFLESRREGVERLQYPAVKVEEVVDSNGVWYEQDKDFVITAEGDIKWTGQKRPGWNTKNGRGTVFSIRYQYTPYFIVTRVLHEIRVAQITDMTSYNRNLERMPYQVEVVREIVFRDNNTTPKSPTQGIRYQNVPDVGGNLGPVGLPSVGGNLGPKKP